MTRAQAEEMIGRHGSMRKAAKAEGVARETLRRAMGPSRPPAAPRLVGNRTLHEFRQEHDQAWKIRDGIKRHFKNGIYMTDSEFREAVGGWIVRVTVQADRVLSNAIRAEFVAFYSAKV